MAIDSNYIGTSVTASNATIAPGLNSGLAIINAENIPRGYYDVECVVGFGGTAESTTINNMGFTRAGVPVYANLHVRNVANQLVTHSFKRVYFTGSQNALIQNFVAGSANSVYLTQITLTRVQ